MVNDQYNKELKSLAEKACYSPAIDETVFPTTISNYYWSSSPNAYYYDGAWSVRFGSGNEDNDFKGNGLHVRLVRGG